MKSFKTQFLILCTLCLVAFNAKSQDFHVNNIFSGVGSGLGLFDFDGDGDLDMLCEGQTLNASPSLWWLENTGNNVLSTIHFATYSYQNPTAYLVDKTKVLDIDEDGDLDLICQSGYENGFTGVTTFESLVIQLNDGSGNFTTYETDGFVHSFDVADLDNDGSQEIYSTYNKNIIRYDWTGSGFIEEVKYTAPDNGFGDRLIEIKCVELNGDNQLDIAFIYRDLTEVDNSRDFVMGIFNTNAIVWNEVTLASGLTGSNPLYHFEDLKILEFADSDNDGDMDMYFNPIVNNGIVNNSGNLHLKRNNGSGTFGNFCSVPSNSFAMNTSYNEIVQLANDNIPDFLNLLDANENDPSRKLHRNVGCSFPGIGEANYLPTAVDFNNDGKRDLYSAHYATAPDFSISLNRISMQFGDGFGNFENSPDSLFVVSPNTTGYNVSIATDFDNNGVSDMLIFDYNEFEQINMDANGLAKESVAKGNFAQANSNQFYAFADMDGNGYKDLIYVASDVGLANPPRDVYVMSNIGGVLTGTSYLAFNNTTSTTNSYTRAFAIADTDNDGDQDILIYHKSLSQNTGKVYLIRNLGNFNFASAAAVTGNFGSDAYAELKILDFEGDGDKDFFLFGNFYRNNGSNNFTLLTTVPIGCESCVFTDFEGDGDLDLVTHESSDYFNTFFYTNSGNFSYSLQQTMPVGIYNSKVKSYDFDGDGFDEIVTEGQILKRIDNTFQSIFAFDNSTDIATINTLPDDRIVTYISQSSNMVLSYDFTDFVSCLSFTPTVSEVNDVLTTLPAGINYQWYDCNSNSEIVGENGQSFSPQDEGNYSVNYTAGACDVSSDCITVTFMPGDFDNSNTVNAADLIILLSDFGCVGNTCSGDIDNNGSTGTSDIIYFMGLVNE